MSNNPNPTGDKPGVTQRAREAAWPFKPHYVGDDHKRKWLKGAWDYLPIVQAFARFEQDTLSREGREAELTKAHEMLRWAREALDSGYRTTRAKQEIAKIDEYFAALSPPASEGRDVGREAVEKAGIFPRIVSHDQAAAAAKNFIDAHFKNADGKGVMTSIPARPDDDDLVLSDYIKQQRALSTAPASPEQAVQADVLRERIAELEAALAKRGAMSVVAGGGQKPYLKITFPRLRDVYDANDALLAALKAQEG